LFYFKDVAVEGLSQDLSMEFIGLEFEMLTRRAGVTVFGHIPPTEARKAGERPVQCIGLYPGFS